MRDVITMNGYRISIDDKWVCTSLDMGSLDWRVQDVDRPGGDGRLFGRDYATPGTIVLTLDTKADTPAEARANIRELAAAWRWSEHRAAPGRFTSLAVEFDGVTGVVFGRPRSFAAEVSEVGFNNGHATVTAEFVPMSDIIFDSATPSQNLHISILPNQSLGLMFPAEAPFIFEGEQTARQGQVVNDSFVPVPFRVAFHGPVTNPKVTSTVGGWEIALNTSVAYDQTIVVDTMAQTVTRESDGASFAHVLTYSSDLSARLVPGGQEVVFSGLDTTNTASVDVSWSNAANGF